MTENPPDQSKPSVPKRIPPFVWGILGCTCLPVLLFVIIGVVMTPSLQGVRNSRYTQDRTVACLNKIRNMTSAVMQYSNDWDQCLPSEKNWMDVIDPFLYDKQGTPLHCDEVLLKDKSAYGYAFLKTMGNKKIISITNTSTTELIFDSTNLARNANDTLESLPNPPRHGSVNPFGRRLRDAKGKRASSKTFNIMGYADGHVSPIDSSMKEIVNLRLE